jgi:hypothetical protein
MQREVLRLPQPLEEHEQALFFQWLDYVTIDGEALRPHCYAIPNGGWRTFSQAVRFKAQGVTAGIADISIDVPAGNFHGLRIEMKRVGCKASGEQLVHIELRRRMGYQASVCEGFDEARRVTVSYLKQRWLVTDRWAN